MVTPLIALMKDQVNRLNSLEIKSMAIHSGMSGEEIDIALDNCIYGDYKFLVYFPWKVISTRLFQTRVSRLNINLVAVDEAHCISTSGGYDFRPSYLKIATMRELISDKVPFLALTASATLAVTEDIMKKLEFRDKNVLRTSFERKNISYMVRQVEDKGIWLVNKLQKARGSGIVYVRSRKRCREIAELMVAKGISADFYHSRREASRVIDGWVRITGSGSPRRAPGGSMRAGGSTISQATPRSPQRRSLRRVGRGQDWLGAERGPARAHVHPHRGVPDAARAIRIHPALDREEVPVFYVEFVVFHEMLHQVVPPAERGGAGASTAGSSGGGSGPFPGRPVRPPGRRRWWHLLLANRDDGSQAAVRLAPQSPGPRIQSAPTRSASVPSDTAAPIVTQRFR